MIPIQKHQLGKDGRRKYSFMFEGREYGLYAKEEDEEKAIKANMDLMQALEKCGAKFDQDGHFMITDEKFKLDKKYPRPEVIEVGKMRCQ